MRCGRSPWFFVLACGAFACGSSPSEPDDDPSTPSADVEPGAPDVDPTQPSTPDAPPLAWLEIRPLDIWGQTLPREGTELTVVTPTGSRTEPAPDTVTIGLYRDGSFSLRLAHEGHLPATLEIAFDGAVVSLEGEAQSPGTAPGILLGHEVRLVEDPVRIGSAPSASGSPIPVHTAYIGLRHRWFAASGPPARRGNSIDLLMDGEEAWARVRTDLRAATRDIKLSTWWWQSDFELVRSDDLDRSQAARRGDTILGLLEHSPAHKRILVGQFWGQDSILSWITTDSAIRAHAERSDDAFELMGQANVTEGSFQLEPATFSFGARVQAELAPSAGQSFDPDPLLESSMPGKAVDLTEWPVSASVQAASYHQKFITIDSDLAFVGGMNLRPVDWDSSRHEVFDPRRMGFSASASAREDVAEKSELPAYGPRKDYMLRIEGPSAQDVDAVFQRRWDHLLAAGVTYAAASTPFTVSRSAEPREGGAQVQITTTMPAPFDEHSIGETWFSAVRSAERYLFIEDQYFRVPMLAETIVARMVEKPELRLFVITKPVAAGTDPGCAPTARMDAMFRYRFFNRYALAQLRSFDVTRAAIALDETDAWFVDVDVHSKMLIVDDVFMSVGSANKNNRGILYEAELNAAIVDPVWVAAARKRILANLLPAETPPSDDSAVWFSQLVEAAAANDAVHARWQAAGMDLDLNGAPVPADYVPHGFLYSLVVPPEGACTIGPVGDDMVTAPPSASEQPWPRPSAP